MILCTIILFQVRNLISGASIEAYRTDEKLHSHLMPHNFGPKCGFSPNDPIFILFFSQPIPLGAKTGALYLYRFQSTPGF